MSRTVPSWLADPVAIIVGDGPGVEAVAHELAAAGATITRGPIADSRERASQAITEASAAATDPVTILVHAGGPFSMGNEIQADPAIWRRDLNRHLDSPFFYASEIARSLHAGGLTGSILFLSAPEDGDGAAQAAAVGGLANLTKTLAVEWARDGIRVNMIKSHVMDRGTKDQLRSLGALAAYLVSDYAAYVTGSIIGTDD